ncbi:MAG: SMC-Scp complex subunit ScpB [Geodermatophilaceae bacterium]|nr:SMC-Scp complex subunit ScpB [Geodermatophilaceae bacterium]
MVDRLDAALEAVLLVVDAPATVEELAVAVDRPPSEVVRALSTLVRFYDVGERGIELREVAGGWRLYTREEFAPAVQRLLLEGQRSRLTQAALETLAVIAYRQPVTRAQIAAIRGVSVDGVVRTLVSRGLITDAGVDPTTQGGRYGTTPLFLDRLGLASLADLPSLAPLLPDLESIDV